RLLAVADLHYSLPQFDWVLESAKDFDVVVLAGDLLELSSLVDRPAQSVVVRKYFSRLREVTRLVICSGNHDLDAPNEAGEKVAKWLGRSQNEGVSSDGESFLFEDTLFTICPWWDGPITRHRHATRRSLEDRAQAVDLDPSRAAGQIADQLGRDTLFRRQRACPMDCPVPAGHRAVRPRPPVALRQGRIMGRSYRS